MKKTWLSFILTLLAGTAHAGEWRYGGALGFGGAGIKSIELVNGVQTEVSRSEGPGMIALVADRLLSDTWAVGAEHLRGFRFGPFSSGASFTGGFLRWYFMGPAPSVQNLSDGGTLFVKRYTPFVAFAGGVATADIKRDNDLAPSVTGSSIYGGIRFGVDYPMAPGWGLRPEITASQTLMTNSALAPTLSEFGIMLGLYFY